MTPFVCLMSPHTLLNKILSVKSEIKMHPHGRKQRGRVHFMELCRITLEFSKNGHVFVCLFVLNSYVTSIVTFEISENLIILYSLCLSTQHFVFNGIFGNDYIICLHSSAT